MELEKTAGRGRLKNILRMTLKQHEKSKEEVEVFKEL